MGDHQVADEVRLGNRDELGDSDDCAFSNNRSRVCQKRCYDDEGMGVECGAGEVAREAANEDRQD